MASIVVLNGIDEGEWFSIAPGTQLIVGRDEDLIAEIHGDPAVSRRHVEIGIDPATRAFVANDLGSRNGIHINGGPAVRRWQLRDGDLVQLGFTVLAFTFEDFAKDRHAAKHAKKVCKNHKAYLDEVEERREKRLAKHIDMTGLEQVGKRR